MDFKLHLHEFFVEGGSREKSHVILHIAEPSTEAELEKGYFFAVCEATNTDTKYIVAMQNVIDDIENRYFEMPETKEDNTFEMVLQKINQDNFLLSNAETEISCAVGIIKDQEIIFAYHGSPLLLLFYKTREGFYRKMDLITADGGGTAAGKQLFPQVVQGRIGLHDFMFIGTPRVAEIFSADRLQKIITTRPARQSAEHLQRVLADLRNELSFGGLVLHITPAEPKTETIKRRPVGAVGSEKSLQNFITTQKNTASTLSPSLVPKLNDQIKSLFNKEPSEEISPIAIARKSEPEIRSAHLRTRAAKPPRSDRAAAWLLKIINIISVVIKYLSQLIWLLLVYLFQLMVWLGRTFLLLIIVAINYKKRRTVILTEWQRQIKFYKNEIVNLSPLTKIIATAVVVALIVLIGSVFYIRQHQQKLAAEKHNKDIIAQINQKKIDIESALIYKDDIGAINALNEAQNLVSNLSCLPNVKQCEIINQELAVLADKAKKNYLVQPELLFDYSQNQISLEKIAKIDNQIFSISSNAPTINLYDSLTRTSKTVKTGYDSGLTAVAVPKENDYLLFLFNKKELIKYDPSNNSFTKADISYENENPEIKSIMVYNRRLYSLDTANNQIYKHDNIKTGFGVGKNWLKDSTVDLRDGFSLTTDGDLFISKTNGEIIKLTGGNKIPFTISGLYPALTGGGEIWTYTDKVYIYLLDSAQKRLIILEKDGKLKAQITASEWLAPTSVVIDESNKIAFVLDSNKLYRVELPL